MWHGIDWWHAHKLNVYLCIHVGGGHILTFYTGTDVQYKCIAHIMPYIHVMIQQETEKFSATEGGMTL